MLNMLHQPSARCLRTTLFGSLTIAATLFATGVFDHLLFSQGIYHVPPWTCNNCFHLNYKYVMRTTDACIIQEDTFLIILVFSKPTDFQQRENIRRMWGSIKHIKNKSVQTVFLLGQNKREDISGKLRAEQKLYDDLVQADFIDDYRNLTIKSLMGLKWVHEFCRGAKFILKTDSDCFVDVHRLVAFLELLPENQDFIGGYCQSVQRSPIGKWHVNEAEYPFVYFPMYCIGLGYVISHKTAQDIIKASHNVPFLWIEDIYITGLCRNVLNVPFTQISGFMDGYIQNIDDCDLKSLKVVHNYKPHSMESLWNMTLSPDRNAIYPRACIYRLGWRSLFIFFVSAVLISLGYFYAKRKGHGKRYYLH